MNSAFYSVAALAAATIAVPAFAQASDSGTQATDTVGTPHKTHNHMPRGKQAGKSGGQYSGVDTAGKREDVKAPYGGHNQAQADAKEAPVTDHLNQMELQGKGPPN
jgi:hypothetical protein